MSRKVTNNILDFIVVGVMGVDGSDGNDGSGWGCSAAACHGFSSEDAAGSAISFSNTPKDNTPPHAEHLKENTIEFSE